MSKEEQRIHASWIHPSLHPWRHPEALGKFSIFICFLLDGSMGSAADIHGEPKMPNLHVCVKLGKSWNCCTQAGSSACACVKATGVKFAFRASGAACKDLDKGPESLHPTWRKSPSVSGKHGQSCSCYCLGKNFCDPTVTDCAWREVVVSTKIKCSVLLLDCSWCAAASGTEADDTDGLDQTIELDSLVRMQTTVAPTNFWDFFSPYTEWILWCKTKSM